MMQSVQVIIERLKTHPEDFFGDKQSDRRTYQGTFPKFQDITEKLDDLLIDKKDVGHIHRLWYLEPEEKEALLAAYKEARRARFEANVFHTLLTKQEPEEYPTTAVRQHPVTSKALMQGFTDARTLWQGAVPKEEGAKIVDHINNAFEKEYAKNRNT
jgi:hypothetical protein